MDLAQQMNATAAHVAHDVSEFKIAGLTAVPGKLVNVPRVAESPVSFECKLTQIIQLQGADGKKAQAWLTLGEVVAVHIDKAMIKDGVYQTALARPIVRAGRRGDYFEIKPDDMFGRPWLRSGLDRPRPAVRALYPSRTLRDPTQASPRPLWPWAACPACVNFALFFARRSVPRDPPATFSA